MEWLQGSVLLDAIFIHFWKEEKSKIIRRAFLPFLMFFIVAHIYYIMFLDPEEELEGVWEIVDYILLILLGFL